MAILTRYRRIKFQDWSKLSEVVLNRYITTTYINIIDMLKFLAGR